MDQTAPEVHHQKTQPSSGAEGTGSDDPRHGSLTEAGSELQLAIDQAGHTVEATPLRICRCSASTQDRDGRVLLEDCLCMGSGSAPRSSLLQPPAAQTLPLSALCCRFWRVQCRLKLQGGSRGSAWRPPGRDSLNCASPSDMCHGRRCSHQGELEVAAGTSSSAARPERDEIEWVKGMEA